MKNEATPAGCADSANTPVRDWPGGAKLAVWITPQLQFAGSFHTRFDDYGHKAGFWRLMDTLDKNGLRASVALAAQDMAKRPDILDACAARDWELYARMPHANEACQQLQAQDVELACDLVRDHGAKPLAGWLAHDAPLSDGSLERLAGAGLLYVANQQYLDHARLLSLQAGSLVELPLCEEACDQRCLGQLGMTAARYARLIGDQFEQLHAEGTARASVFGLPLHPAVVGMPHNLREFEAVIADITSRDKVWFATAREIAHWLLHGRHDEPGESE